LAINFCYISIGLAGLENVLIKNPLEVLTSRSMMQDEAFYAEALRELESGVRRDGLWAMAIVRSEGKEDSVKPLYLQFLAAAIKEARTRRADVTTNDFSTIAQPKAAGEYFYMLGGQSVGPVSGREMKRLGNKLKASTPVRSSAMDGWSDLLRMRSLLDQY
jgi:hypothetical protein